MKRDVVRFHPPGPLVVLVGNPNCGKTALFNRLTGSRQKVANYAGVTVERKEGRLVTPAGAALRMLDLPGVYSLSARSPDEQVTVQVLQGRLAGERRPTLVVCVVDATNLRRSLRLVLAVRRLGIPCIVALNMIDAAERRGIPIDPAALSAALGVPVAPTVAIQPRGADALLALLDDPDAWPNAAPSGTHDAVQDSPAGDHEAVQAILARLGLDHVVPHTTTDRIDRIVLHPVAGPVLLAVLLFSVFQAVFVWAAVPMDWIKEATERIGDAAAWALPEGWLRSLVVDGIVAGAGAVVVFLPQIVILFFFILLLEESGYLPRAAFLLDRLMGGVGLSGRAFIPLLSSFACAIPGIMAARTVPGARDRLVTILIAPLMTCSARLPVYALLIAAFVPSRRLAGVVELQGVVLFLLYLAGIAGGLVVAWVLSRFGARGGRGALMMELPVYHWPTARSLAIGLWQRATIFVRRVGGIILVLSVALWFLASFPAPPPGATGSAIEYSFAGVAGKALATAFAPIGFNWQISVALIPGLAAREVAVGALGTVYALSAGGADAAHALAPIIARSWSVATGLALLAWYVFAPQCLATLATVRRETGGWATPIGMAAYLFALAYLAAFATYHLALALGAG